MSQGTQRILLVVLLLVVSGVVGWSVWSGRLGGLSGDEEIELDVLCAKCGYFGRMDAASLTAGGGGTRAPAFGPGSKCPKCQQQSLYANPIVCEQCRTPYFMTLDAHGAVQAKCSKCGKTP